MIPYKAMQLTSARVTARATPRPPTRTARATSGPRAGTQLQLIAGR